MPALISVWMGLACLLLSLAMLLWRPAMTDVAVTIALWGAAATMALAGLVLWGLRNEPPSRAVRMQRVQAGAAIVLALAGAAIVYVLVITATPVPRRTLSGAGRLLSYPLLASGAGPLRGGSIGDATPGHWEHCPHEDRL